MVEKKTTRVTEKKTARVTEKKFTSAIEKIQRTYSKIILIDDLKTAQLLRDKYAAYYAIFKTPFTSLQHKQWMMEADGYRLTKKSYSLTKITNDIKKIENTLIKIDTSGRPITQICYRICVLNNSTGYEKIHIAYYLKKGLTELKNIL